MCLGWNDQPLRPAPILVSVRGHLIGPQPGDVLSVSGLYGRPDSPANPGEFDFQEWMWREGYLGSLIAEHPRHVKVIQKEHESFRYLLKKLRSTLLFELERSIGDPEIAAVASALVLGDRSDLPDEMKEAFIRSGTFHLLAISGLHVGLIAGVLMRIFRITNFSARRSALITILLLILYSLLTGLRPSVFRATLFLVIFLGGRAIGRQSSAVNSLGLTGFIILVWNPENLFANGVQLSFLSVVAILSVRPLLGRQGEDDSLYAKMTEGLPVSRLRLVLMSLKQAVRDGVLIGGAVSLLTFPVSATNFHLFPFWGIPLTILLIPVVTLSLSIGILLLMSSLLLPSVCEYWGWVLEGLLSVVIEVSEFISQHPNSIWTLKPVAAWWVFGYIVLMLWLFLSHGRHKIVWLGLFCWAMLHVAVSQISAREEGFRMTTYSVGHGIAILLEYPDGEKHLYDCGSNDGGRRAAQVLLSDFKMRGIRHLDRVYLSHADLDHYSALPEILTEVDVDEIMTTEMFLSSQEPNVRSLITTIKQTECELSMAQRGDLETIGKHVRIEVLHPATERFYSSDNAASLVLKVKYAGSVMLLTGDVDAEGLFELLEQSTDPVDCFLAPHHGSVSANTPQLAEWCEPSVVVVSNARGADMEYLKKTYRYSRRLHNTHQDGALILEISPSGQRTWTSWKSQSSVSD